MTHADWYERNFHRLSGAGNWLAGGEAGTLPAAAWDERPYRVLVARLSTWRDTAHSATHHLLYRLAAGTPGVFPDLAFLPPPRDGALLAAEGVPWLLGTGTKRGPADFDLLALSNAVLLELLDLPGLLERSGLPLAAAERLARPDLPLVVLGGANAPHSTAAWLGGWVDAVFIGESLPAIRALLEAGRDAKAAGLGKAATLERLAALPGVLLPGGSGTVRRAAGHGLEDEGLAEPLLSAHPEAVGLGHLSIDEGCPGQCSFCAEGWTRRPYRPAPAADVIRRARRLKAGGAVEHLELQSDDFSAHPELGAVLAALGPLVARVGLKSQRADHMARDPALLEWLAALGKTSLSIGLEGVSGRLRRVLHKNLSDADLHRALEAALRAGARQVKVFAMVTGLEEAADLEEFRDTLAKMERQRAKVAPGCRVLFSVAPLVRFPLTPLEDAPAPALARLLEAWKAVAEAVRASGLEFHEAATPAAWWTSQVLARAADPRVPAAVLAALGRVGGSCHGTVGDPFRAALAAALAEAGLDEAAALSGAAASKPWARLDTGVDRGHLARRAELAARGEEAPLCRGRPWAAGACDGCGACPPAERAAMCARPGTRTQSLRAFEERMREARREAPLGLLVEAAAAEAGRPRRFLAALLARALMAAAPELVEPYRRAGEGRFPGEDPAARLEGLDALTLFFAPVALPRLRALLADPAFRAAADAALGGRLRLLGPAPEDWTPARILVASPFPADPEAWTRHLRLKGTKRRDGAGGWTFELAPASRRNPFARALSWRPAGEGAALELVPGPRFDPADFLRRAILLPAPADAARVRLRATDGA